MGDLHGRHNLYAPAHGYKVLPAQPPGTQLIFLGDYIDRGSDSQAILMGLMAHQAHNPQIVLGSWATMSACCWTP